MKSAALALAVAFVVAGLLTYVSGVLVASVTVKSSGVLASANLGVYSDSACTQSLGSVDWGTVAPGNSVSRTFYVKNVGSTQVTLSLLTANWNPTGANGPVTVSWNRQGTTLIAGQATAATLTLSVSSEAGGFAGFSLDAVVTGTA